MPEAAVPQEEVKLADRMREYAEMQLAKTQLNADLKELNAKISAAQEALAEAMQEEGVQNTKVELDDGSKKTIYLYRDLQASFRNTDEAFEALEELGLSDNLTTTVNSSRAKALCKEIWDGTTEEPPELLAKAFSLYEQFKVGVRSAK